MSATATAARQELKSFIDVIPERSFDVVRNFLLYLVDAPANVVDKSLIIETDLTTEEAELIAEGMRDYDSDPSTFTPWETAKKELELA
jgi:hypothetical protein